MINTVVMGEYGLLFFLATCEKLIKYGTWFILSEKFKPCNILKTVDRRAKGRKVGNCHMNCLCRVHFMSDSFEFSLGSFGARCEISYVKILRTLLLPHFSFSFQPHFMKSRMMAGGIHALTFLAVCHIFKNLHQFEDVTSATLPLAINLSWFHLAKSQKHSVEVDEPPSLNKRPMGPDALLQNQLGHLPKFHMYSLSTPRGQNWAYLHPRSSGFRDTGRFSKLPFLGMKLGPWPKCQKLHVYPLSPRGAK